MVRKLSGYERDRIFDILCDYKAVTSEEMEAETREMLYEYIENLVNEEAKG